MVRVLSENWWLVALRGVFAILFGIAAFVWPGLTLLSLIVLFGVYAVVDGAVAVVTGLLRTKDTPRWWTFLVEGLLGIAAGVVALILPELTVLVMIYILAGWAVVTGLLEIAAAVRLRDEITNEWGLGLGGLVSIVLGILLTIEPVVGSFAIVWTIGGYAVLFGILLVILGLRLRNWQAPQPRQSIPSL